VVLAGAIDRYRSGYNVSVKAIDPAADTEIATFTAGADNKDAVLNAVSELAGRVREQLGDTTLTGGKIAAAETFTAASLDAFFEREWRVSPQSDRRGLRLEGAPLEHVHAAEVDPVGAAPGSVQVPGGGLPIVLGPDGPVTGGYPRIATVIGADLHRLGQAAPGDAVRFVPATLEDALAAYLRGRTGSRARGVRLAPSDDRNT